MKIAKTKTNFGQTLVEVLVGVAIFSLILTPFLSSLLNLTTANVKYRHQTQAVQHAREALEIAYNLSVNADTWDDFAALANNPDPNNPDLYHPVLSVDGVYALSPDEQKIGRFYRALFFQKAKRDLDGNLTEDPAAPEEDDNTIKVTAKVTWDEGGGNQEIELNTYLIDLSAF